VVTGGAAVALNGNLPANRVQITHTITGLNIPAGSEVMLRWSDPDHPGADHGMAIDEVSVTALATDADVAVVLSDNPDPVSAGTQLTYTATVNNGGPADAQNVSLSLPLPAGTSFVSASPSPGGTCTHVSPITCT
jgi:uncharacterized repeat protein (TIGR01451 family)